MSYHFATKQALLDGLVDAFVDTVEQEWAAAERTGLSTADAYIAVSLMSQGDTMAARAILVAVTDSARTRDRIDVVVKGWYKRIRQSSTSSDGDVVRCLAADAIWLLRLHGQHPIPVSTARRLPG